MTRLARLSPLDRSPPQASADLRAPRLRTRFYAFLSYSHKDKELADWLHRELERFRVPHSLAGKLTANGVVPRRLTPIFRDQHDLSAGGDLAQEIRAALAASQFLVVLCSPTAAKSRWMNEEIESFKRTRPENCVIAAIAAGEPFASDISGREEEECFPPALRYKYDRRGHRTTKHADPLAADFRFEGEGRRLAFLKLVSGMLGIGLDELVQRDQTRRQRRLAYLAAASLAGMAATSTLALTAIQARDSARDQRREAEGLIGFMLGDLKDKLEPIGKLDALDGVGERVLAYYHNQSIADLSDSALSQRSRALSLMANVAMQRGNNNVAVRLYRESMAGTGEAIRRNPDEPQRLFDHAQNVFYVGEIAYFRGDLNEAASRMNEYKMLADRMVALDANNMKWRMEVQNATASLGSVRLAQRRFTEAADLAERSLNTIEALTTADPNNRDYRQSLVEALAWSADVERDAGHIDKAIAVRERHVSLLNRLLSQTGDSAYRWRLSTAERKLGFLYAVHGDPELARKQTLAAIAQGEALGAIEPNNNLWLDILAEDEANLAYLLMMSGKPDEAAVQNEASCAIVVRLVAKDPSIAEWRTNLRECWITRGYVALSRHANDEAAAAAEQAVLVTKGGKSPDAGADAFALAGAYRLLGDARSAGGNKAAAMTAWEAAFAALPRVPAERPFETHERSMILKRLGRTAEARQLDEKLARAGYRLPDLVRS